MPAGRDLLVALKATAGAVGPAVCIPVGTPIESTLRPVCTVPGQLNAEDVGRLTAWRNRYVSSFLTEFTATDERTAHWLEQSVGMRDDKIIFMLDDLERRTFGYLGLDFIDWEKGYGEADSVVRGEPALQGGMARGLRTLLAWAHGQLGLVTLGVRVRSDNPALVFYEKLGFEEHSRVPLRRVEETDRFCLIEDPNTTSDVSLVHMLYAATGYAATSK